MCTSLPALMRPFTSRMPIIMIPVRGSKTCSLVARSDLSFMFANELVHFLFTFTARRSWRSATSTLTAPSADQWSRAYPGSWGRLGMVHSRQRVACGRRVRGGRDGLCVPCAHCDVLFAVHPEGGPTPLCDFPIIVFDPVRSPSLRE